MQIIINRIAILSVDRTVVSRIKWGVFFLILLINISVVCIWVPANLQISDELIRINNIWDRIQKGLICIIDAALNFYFIHLVRSQLVAKGLTKYTRLFRFNLFMIGISVILDIMIVTMMSLHNKLMYDPFSLFLQHIAHKYISYVQFHPLAYLLKLQIELGMADLIIKIVRATKPGPSSSEPYPHYANTTMASTRGQLNRGNFQSWNSNRQNQPHVSPGSNADAVEMEMYANAIKKTVVAEVLSSDDTKRPGSQGSDDEMISENSSTRRLKGEPMV